MDQEKIGRFICECRKRKNITQMELADKLLVSNRAVSKWEKGKSMPDVSLFNPLCEILDITINELLTGEKNNKDANITIEAINYYNGKRKRINFLIICGIAIFMVLSFLSLYMFNNYEFFVNGYLMLNQKNKILTINRLDFNFETSDGWCGCEDCVCPDILAEDMIIRIYKDEVVLKEISNKELNSQSNYLADTIKNITVNLNDLDEKMVRNWDSEGYRIVISYNVYNDDTIYDVNLDIKLDLHEIYANNKVFY